MHIPTSSPLAFVELLANRNCKPSALQVDTTSIAWLEPLLEHPDFHKLTSHFPCVVTDPGALPQQVALQAAGFRFIAPTAILRPDSLPEKVLPPATQWLGGDWYLAPPASPSRSQAASRALALQLVQLVMADADTHEIEAVLRRDPTLSYHLLRLVNSLGMGMSKRISSFSQAILILGRAQLRRWLNLMVFSSRQGDARSAMLLARVAVRARAMELLAKASGLDRSGQELAFMAGMFSLLGVLFGLPLDEVLKPLKISDELAAALLQHEGDLGSVLQLVEAAERGDLATAAGLLDALQVSYAEFNLLTVQAYAWMGEVIHESTEDAHT